MLLTATTLVVGKRKDKLAKTEGLQLFCLQLENLTNKEKSIMRKKCLPSLK